ncbi:hypothetical protein BH09ACT5_BH09ACT5_01140 [soil metagenome]
MNIIGFVVSLVIFVLGFYVMGSAFYVTGAEFPVFIGGILLSSLGLFIPVHILKRINS